MEIQTIKETIAPVVDQAHWHDNLAVLNEMTADKSTSALERKIDFLQDNLMDYQMATNHRFETVEAELKEIREMLEMLGGGSAVTLFQSGSDTLSKYGELLYTFFNDGFRSLSGFVKSYPNFCNAANDYALSYSQSDFGWAGVVYTICTTAVSITPKSCIMFSYKAGAADSGELYLVRKNANLSGSALANYIYEQIENETAFVLPFRWLYSDIFVSVMQSCENIPAGDFYLAWRAVSDNTHPIIRTVKILEG